MNPCEYQIGFQNSFFKGLGNNHLIKKYCGKPGKKFEYWFFCPKHKRMTLERLAQLKKEKLRNLEIDVKRKGEK